MGIVVAAAIQLGLQGHELLLDTLYLTLGGAYVGIEAIDELLLLLNLRSQGRQGLQLSVDILLGGRQQLF